MPATPLRIAPPPAPPMPVDEARMEVQAAILAAIGTLDETRQTLERTLSNDVKAETHYSKVLDRLHDETIMARASGNEPLAIHIEATRELCEAAFARDTRDDAWQEKMIEEIGARIARLQASFDELRDANLKAAGE